MLNIEALVKEYNAKYFDGILANIPVQLYNRKGRVHGFFRVKQRSFPSLHFNLRHSGSDNMMKETILHEMTHAYLWMKKMPYGHSPFFKRMMKNLVQKEFGIAVNGNPRFVLNIDAQLAVKNTPIPSSLPVAPVVVPVPANASTLYKVLSNGMVGTLVRESMAYGKRMITLKVEGNLFPFTTEMTNVQRIDCLPKL